MFQWYVGKFFYNDYKVYCSSTCHHFSKMAQVHKGWDPRNPLKGAVAVAGEGVLGVGDEIFVGTRNP